MGYFGKEMVLKSSKKLKVVARDFLPTHSTIVAYSSIEEYKNFCYFTHTMKSTKETNESEETFFLDKKDEIEITDEINNSRKKRRRSSANIE